MVGPRTLLFHSVPFPNTAVQIQSFRYVPLHEIRPLQQKAFRSVPENNPFRSAPFPTICSIPKHGLEIRSTPFHSLYTPDIYIHILFCLFWGATPY